MKNVKMTIVAATLLLATAGVFAGKGKFTNSIYASKAGTAVEIAPSFISGSVSTTVNGSQISITDHAGTSFLLYADVNLTVPLYSTSAY